MPRESFGGHTPASLEKLAVRLGRAAASLRSVAQAMTQDGIGEITVKLQDGMLLGIGNLETFADNARNAYNGVLCARNEYGAAKEKEESSRQRKKKARSVSG